MTKSGALPSPDEPLVTEDGTAISPDGEVLPSDSAEVPPESAYGDSSGERTSSRRKLSDLPCPPERLQQHAMLWCLSVLGVREADTAAALNLSKEDVRRLRHSHTYHQLDEMLSSDLVKHSLEDVRDYITTQQRSAAEALVEQLESNNAKIRQDAARALLQTLPRQGGGSDSGGLTVNILGNNASVGVNNGNGS